MAFSIQAGHSKACELMSIQIWNDGFPYSIDDLINFGEESIQNKMADSHLDKINIVVFPSLGNI